ncbi:MAG: lipopolysaccharide assembly protein LapA domain-containing protein [Calditrichia bacterium]
MKPKFIAIWIIIILILIIIFQNLDPVLVQILLWEVAVSLLLVILLAFLLGVILGWLLKASITKNKRLKEKPQPPTPPPH